MRIACFDLETAKGPQECGGWGDKKGMGISSGVVWCNWEGGRFGRYRIFRGDRVAQMASMIESCDLLISFNGISFDIPLINAVAGREIEVREHCDLMALFFGTTGYRIKLDALAEATLSEGKIGHGQHAPQLARDQRWDELHDYNMRDVELTLRLYYFAREHGYLLCMDKKSNQLRRVPLQVPGGVEAYQPKNFVVHQHYQKRHAPATAKQISFLVQLHAERGLHGWQPTPGLTKAQASGMIESMKNERAA